MEDERILLSYLNEYGYCKRRFYLKYIENTNEENYYIVDGTIKHENVHKHDIIKMNNIIKCSNFPIYSIEYNLYGKTDELNFLYNPNGVYISQFDNTYTIEIIEHKRKYTPNDISSSIQLCGQVLCLEEMYKTTINVGYIKDIINDKIIEIEISNSLRKQTIDTIREIKELLNEPKLVPIIKKKRCNKCSLFEKCNPNIDMVNEYVNSMWGEVIDTN